MRQFVRRMLMTVATCVTILCGQGLLPEATQVFAAPQMMSDGNYFDAEYYAAQNPDVVALMGVDPNVLYMHYLAFGVNEGRSPFENGSIPAPERPLYEYTEDELVQIIIARIITPDMDAMQRAVAINDYLCEHVTYDYSYSHHSTYDALAYGTGVCQGYANAYWRLMNAAGVPTDYVRGYGWTGSSWGRHGWNRSLIGGQYYYTDVTWNDTSNDRTRNRYLLVSYETMSRDHSEVSINPRRIM